MVKGGRVVRLDSLRWGIEVLSKLLKYLSYNSSDYG